MTDKTLKILLGIIAVNLTFQTVKDVGLFPTAFAQDEIQRVEICGTDYEGQVFECVKVDRRGRLQVGNVLPDIN
jgi:hypothetical protein